MPCSALSRHDGWTRRRGPGSGGLPVTSVPEARPCLRQALSQSPRPCAQTSPDAPFPPADPTVRGYHGAWHGCAETGILVSGTATWSLNHATESVSECGCREEPRGSPQGKGVRAPALTCRRRTPAPSTASPASPLERFPSPCRLWGGLTCRAAAPPPGQGLPCAWRARRPPHTWGLAAQSANDVPAPGEASPRPCGSPRRADGPSAQ